MVWVFSVTVARELTNTTADRLLVEIVLVRLCFPRLNYFVTENEAEAAVVCAVFFFGLWGWRVVSLLYAGRHWHSWHRQSDEKQTRG